MNYLKWDNPAIATDRRCMKAGATILFISIGTNQCTEVVPPCLHLEPDFYLEEAFI